MQISVIHVKREKICPKRVGNDLDRYCSSRGESLSAKNVQPLNPRSQDPINKTPNHQEHPRPEGNILRDEFHSGLRPGSHERPNDVCTASSQEG